MVKNHENGLQAQLVVHPNKNLADKEVVAFDRTITQSGSDICLMPNGKIKICSAGLFLVNWNISVAGTDTKPFARFAITVNNKIHGASARPTAVGELYSSNLVAVARSPCEIALVNDTGDIVQLSKISPIANITIVQITKSNSTRRCGLCQLLFN